MKIGFFVNDIDELGPLQTTTMLIHRAARAGHETYVVPIDCLQVDPDRSLHGYGRSLGAHQKVADALADLHQASSRPVALDELDILMLRTNPARDARAWAHDAALQCAELLEDRGVLVVNRPAALRRRMSKMMLTRIAPSVLPATLITRDRGAFERFVQAAPGDVVAKPVAGTRGSDVFRIEQTRATNVRQIFDVLTRDGYCMAQHFVPEAHEGDVRLIVLNGQLLEVDGQIAAVRRVPGKGDFRSNIAQGGNAAPVEVTDSMRAVVDTLGADLAAEGLWIVGLDLIGSKIVEVNVFSTGGLNHSELFYGSAFVDAMLDWVLARRAG